MRAALAAKQSSLPPKYPRLNIIIDPAVLWDPLLDLLADYCEPGGIPREDITCIKPPDPNSYCPPGFEEEPP